MKAVQIFLATEGKLVYSPLVPTSDNLLYQANIHASHVQSHPPNLSSSEITRRKILFHAQNFVIKITGFFT